MGEAAPSDGEAARSDQASPGFSLRYELTADALVDAGRLYRQRTFRLLAIAGWLLIGSGLIIAVAGITLLESDSLPWYGGWAAATGILVLFATRSRAFGRWAARRQAGAILGETTTVTINEEGLGFQTPIFTGSAKWMQITAVREDERTVLFERDRIAVGYVPVSAFGDPERRAEIVAFARRKIDEARADRVKVVSPTKGLDVP